MQNFQLPKFKTDTPTWFGFVLFIFSITLIQLLLFITTPILFYFLFDEPIHEFILLSLYVLAGTSLAAAILRVTNSSLKMQAEGVAKNATIWFLALNISILLFAYFGDQTPSYGVTPREELVTLVPFSAFLSVLYYVVNKGILKR